MDMPAVCREISCGNADAERFALRFMDFCHAVDDLLDGDSSFDKERLVRVLMVGVLEFTMNPFYQMNRHLLLPLIIQGSNAFLDSERFAASANAQDRRKADVFKAFYSEVLWHIAFLTGGFEFMREMSRKHRVIDHDCNETEGE